MITNNTFLDGIIHRQMRKHLLETFDEIYVLDLHGNAKKKETAPDGSKDENVFDIMQGVAISIMIRKSDKKDKLGILKFAELYGTRGHKFLKLNDSDLKTVKWNLLKYNEPEFFFVKKNFNLKNEYSSGLKIDKLFIKYNNGIETGKDFFFYDFSREDLIKKLNFAFSNKDETIVKYNIKNTSSFKFLEKFKASFFNENKIRLIHYRPFDIKFNYYDEKLQRRPAYSTMKNLFGNNLGLLVPRQVADTFKHIFITKYPSDCNLTGTAKKFGSAPIFPLYLYSENGTKVPNLKKDIVDEIEKIVGKITPEEILD